MNDILWNLLLLSVPGLPLLLAFPPLHSRLPWFRYLAVTPAIIVALMSMTYSIELSWLLFGIGLGIDGQAQLLLGVSALLWIAVATLFSRKTSNSKAVNNLISSLFMLTMAGSFGAILATDLVGFFVFSTLMGYGFYGLLITGDDLHHQTRRAARIYLVAMIIADVMLFEVLLITALVTENMSFAMAHQGIAQSDYLTLYLWLVVFGFALKAGIWPLHFWLIAVYRHLGSAMAILLCGVPVIIALLGMLRWLPLGETSSITTGVTLQGIGLIGLLYTCFLIFFEWLKNRSFTMITVYTMLLASGLFIIAIGTGLTDATTWIRYENSVYYFIALLSLALAILLALTIRLQQHHTTTTATQVDDNTAMWFERWPATAVAWAGNIGSHTLPEWRSGWLAKVNHLGLLVCVWKRSLAANERNLQGWTVAITLFLTLAAIITLLLIFH